MVPRCACQLAKPAAHRLLGSRAGLRPGCPRAHGGLHKVQVYKRFVLFGLFQEDKAALEGVKASLAAC